MRARTRGERSRVVPPSKPTFPRELPSSRMLVTLALGDSRLVYAVICSTMDDLNSSGASMDESPGIPAGRKQALSLSLSLFLFLLPSKCLPHLAADKGRKRTCFVISLAGLARSRSRAAETKRTWSKFKDAADPHRSLITRFAFRPR